jgi:hypothetical protein
MSFFLIMSPKRRQKEDEKRKILVFSSVPLKMPLGGPLNVWAISPYLDAQRLSKGPPTASTGHSSWKGEGDVLSAPFYESG